jgi:dynein heavy chain
MENRTLKEVSQTEGNLLDNELVVNELYSIRGNTGAVEKRIQQSKDLEQRTDDTREQYRPIASRGAVLYEILRDFAYVNPMYQIGLQQFLILFKNTLVKSIPSSKIPVRINNLLKDLNSSVFSHFSCGLPNEHRILFAFLIACKTQRSTTVSDIEWNLLINPDNVPPKQVTHPIDIFLSSQGSRR